MLLKPKEENLKEIFIIDFFFYYIDLYGLYIYCRSKIRAQERCSIHTTLVSEISVGLFPGLNNIFQIQWLITCFTRQLVYFPGVFPYGFKCYLILDFKSLLRGLQLKISRREGH